MERVGDLQGQYLFVMTPKRPAVNSGGGAVEPMSLPSISQLLSHDIEFPKYD